MVFVCVCFVCVYDESFHADHTNVRTRPNNLFGGGFQEAVWIKIRIAMFGIFLTIFDYHVAKNAARAAIR